MKYIHGKNIPGRVPAGAIVRMILGCLSLIAYLALILMGVSSPGMYSLSYYKDVLALIFYTASFGGGGFILLFTGIKSLKRGLKGIPMRDPNKNEPLDPVNPFFTATCPGCATVFDYQRSDLGHRAWYPNGFVVCPQCRAIIRHNAEKNVYYEAVPETYTYRNI